MSIRIAVLPMLCRLFSSSIKKNPSLDDVDASCIWQDSSPYTSENGKVYELVLDVGLSPRRDTYKGREIIEKKLQIDPHFRSQVEQMKKLAKLAAERLKFESDFYFQNTLSNLIDHEPLISKNGKHFECNAWLHSDYRQSICEEERKQSKPKPISPKKLTESRLYAPEDPVPWFAQPRWLKDHPKGTSVRLERTVWNHPSGSRYEISIWAHSIPEEESSSGIINLYSRIEAAGQPFEDKVKALKILAGDRLSHVLEQRKPPIYIAAVKAAMVAEGEFPLCTDVHITDHDIFEISAQVSQQPEQEAKEVNEALQASALKCRSAYRAINEYGMIIFYRAELIGPAPDNVVEGTMVVTERLEHTKELLRLADEGNPMGRKELGWLAKWEANTTFTDEDQPLVDWPPLQFSCLPPGKKD